MCLSVFTKPTPQVVVSAAELVVSLIVPVFDAWVIRGSTEETKTSTTDISARDNISPQVLTLTLSILHSLSSCESFDSGAKVSFEDLVIVLFYFIKRKDGNFEVI